MKFMTIPEWLYFPFKLLLLASFLIPVLLWGGQMLGFSLAQETALAKKELQSTERQAEVAKKYFAREGSALESQATSASGLVEKEGEHILSAAQKEVSEKTRTLSQGPQGHTESAKGIDVSHYQGLVRWDHAAEAGIHFGFVKATGGEHYVDPRFHENWHSMRAAEVPRGAYHFYYAAENPRAQANHFIATVRKLRPSDLPPVLDVEISDYVDQKKIIEGTLVWLETVEKALGKRPVLYTDPGFGDQYLKDSRLSKYPLWIADYAEQAGSLPSPWKKAGWTFWQHSQKGTVPGVAGTVDLNVFKGTPEDLQKFIADTRL